MIKALENFTHHLDGKPLQLYSGQIASLPEGDEAFLISQGRAEKSESGGGSGSTALEGILPITFEVLIYGQSMATSSITCDKTFEELSELVLSGKIILAKVDIITGQGFHQISYGFGSFEPYNSDENKIRIHIQYLQADTGGQSINIIDFTVFRDNISMYQASIDLEGTYEPIG